MASPGHHPPGHYEIFHVTTVVDCLVEEQSKLKRFADGRIFAATRLTFDSDRLGSETHCFRIPQGITTAFYITDTFVNRVTELGLAGLAPVEIWNSKTGSNDLGLTK